MDRITDIQSDTTASTKPSNEQNQSQKQCLSSSNGLIIACESKADSKHRLKQMLSLCGINVFYGPILWLLLVLIYQTLYKKNLKAFFALYLIQGYTSLYAKKNETILKLVRWFEFQKWFNSYKVYCEEPLDDNSTLFPWMPHHIMLFSLLSTLSLKDSPFKNSTILGTSLAIESPFLGTFCKWCGLGSVKAKNFKALMEQKKNICFVPGGFEEASLTSNKEYRIFADRKGFIKYGLQYGYNVCPVFVFNENRGYQTSDKGMDFRLKLNKLKLPGALFFSKYGLVPDKNIDIVIVVGKKIALPKIATPSNEDIDQYHMIFLRSIRQLFNENVEKFHPGAKLVFHSKNQNINDL